jgi:hypothetical protein
MKVMQHATIIITTERGERDLNVKDLTYDADLKAFFYVHAGSMEATLREHVRGFRTWEK